MQCVRTQHIFRNLNTLQPDIMKHAPPHRAAGNNATTHKQTASTGQKASAEEDFRANCFGKHIFSVSLHLQQETC